MYSVNQYSPYPYGFGGDAKTGAYCEIDINNGKTSRFIVIKARAYMKDKERKMQLVRDGVMSWEDIYPEIIHLGYFPDSNYVFWLYRVYVCDIDKNLLKESDSEIFAMNAVNCEEFVFDDFEKCISFLMKKYEVCYESFVKKWQTNYPRY